MQTIGRYQVTGELGRGAMGIVYRATDPAIGRTVAIKTIRLTELVDSAEQSRLRERLFREAQSAGILSHPNIVTIYDIAEQGGVAYIAMEFVDGPTLERRFYGGPLDRAQVIDILHQTASALDYAHSKGIIHRDIKPANIMLHEDKIVKIADFGVARIQSQQMTQMGTLMGTPNYMSPEQIQGLAIEGRADQFSLAVIAFELLTGEKPFAGESVPTVVFKIVNEQPQPAQRINPSLGWPIDTVLKRGLSKTPQERYATCRDFIQALDNATKSAKDWRPLPPGASQAMPTLMEAAAPPPPDPEPPPPQDPVPVAIEPPPEQPAPRPVPLSRPPTVDHDAVTAPLPSFLRQAPPEPVEERPFALRAVRGLAIVLLSAVLLGAAILGAMKYLSSRPTTTVTETQPPPAQEPPVAEGRPSPMTREEQPPAAPAESPVATPETPSRAEPAKENSGESSSPPRQAAPSTAEASIQFDSTPSGALVTVDGASTSSCTTPCSLTLTGGRHTLSSVLAGYRRALRIFEIPNDTQVSINLERATGTLMVRSQPSGAAVTVNGQERAERTPTAITLPVGKYRIEVAKDGYPKDTEDVEIKDSVMTNLDVNWPSRNP